MSNFSRRSDYPTAYYDSLTRIYDRLDKVYNTQMIKYKLNGRANKTLY